MRKTPSRVKVRLRNARFVTRSAKTRPTKLDLSSMGSTDAERAAFPDFNYSTANKNSEIVWNDASFKEYIKDPNAKVPGTTMIFAGIKNEKEADDLWAYLKQFDPAGRVKK
jgi:cytochrome c2